MIHAFRLLAGTVALATSVFVAEASGAELKVLSAGAMRAALQELAPAFEAASGNKLKIEYSTAGDIEKKVAAGDEIDVAILTKPRVVLDTKVSPPVFLYSKNGLLSVLSGRWLTTCHTGEAAACQANVDRIGLY